MEGREPLVKIAYVASVNNIEAVVWRRGERVMSDQDVDDVAFLTGTDDNHSSLLIDNACDAGGVVGTESPTTHNKKSLYENNGVAACSQNRALCIATIVFAILFTVSVIIAYTGPQSGKILNITYVFGLWVVRGIYVIPALNACTVALRSTASDFKPNCYVILE